MSYVGLHRAHKQVFSGLLKVFAKDSAYGIKFDGVTKPCAGTVKLNVVHILRFHSCILKCLSDDLLLSLSAGCSKAVAPGILIHSRARYNGIYGIPIPYCVGVLFKENHAASFASDISVGALIAGLAL